MGRNDTALNRGYRLAALLMLGLAVAACQPPASPQAELQGKISSIRAEAEALTGGKVKVTSAWVGQDGNLCGLMQITGANGVDQVGRFGGVPGNAGIETERETGLTPGWSATCGERLIEII